MAQIAVHVPLLVPEASVLVLLVLDLFPSDLVVPVAAPWCLVPAWNLVGTGLYPALCPGGGRIVVSSWSWSCPFTPRHSS